MTHGTAETNQVEERGEPRRRGQERGGEARILKVICLAIMAGGTLVFEGIIDRLMLVITEAAGEGVHVQVIEEHTQNRNAFDPVFVREREWIVDGTGDRFWMRLEIVVQQSCYYLPGITLSISLLLEPGLDWR